MNAAPLPSALTAGAFAGHWRDDAGRRADAAVHLVGGIAALLVVPVILMASGASGAGLGWPLGAYAVAIAALFPASALFQHGPEAWRGVSIKLDHAAIYLKVAATGSALAAVSGATGAAPLVGLWLLALCGAALRALGPARMPRRSLGLHLLVLLGGLPTTLPAVEALPADAQRLALFGAAACLAGLPFHLAPGLRFGQAIWHAMVLVATGALCASILTALSVA